jgi:hypothetical protein
MSDKKYTTERSEELERKQREKERDLRIKQEREDKERRCSEIETES